MRTMITVVSLSLLAGSVPLVHAASAEKSAAKTAATPKSAAPAKPATHSVSGTVESYDASGKSLTVKGTKSTWTFSAAGAQVWEGSKSISLDDLSSQSGSKVSVKYTDEGGEKRASSIRVTPAHAAKTASKSH
jgi:phage baseplate assembly protein gpV